MQLSNDGTTPRDLRWPSWKLDVNWWLAAISFVLGFVVFFFPEIEDKAFEHIRIKLGVFLLALPVLLLSLMWCWRSFGIAAQRIISYPKLFAQNQTLFEELNDAKNRIAEIAGSETTKNGFELLNARIDRNEIYIAIKKKSAPKLNLGDVLVVIHKDGNMLMGVFEVSEILSACYHAKSKSNIDPVWKSYLQQRGESRFLPNMVSIFMNRGKSDGHQNREDR